MRKLIYGVFWYRAVLILAAIRMRRFAKFLSRHFPVDKYAWPEFERQLRKSDARRGY